MPAQIGIVSQYEQEGTEINKGRLSQVNGEETVRQDGDEGIDEAGKFHENVSRMGGSEQGRSRRDKIQKQGLTNMRAVKSKSG